jgi:hypothetical protein
MEEDEVKCGMFENSTKNTCLEGLSLSATALAFEVVEHLSSVN